MPYWSVCSCYFCPQKDTAALEISADELADKICQILDIPSVMMSKVEAICQRCLENVDLIARACSYKEAMKNYFRLRHANDIERQLGFAFNITPSGATLSGDHHTSQEDFGQRRRCGRATSSCHSKSAPTGGLQVHRGLQDNVFIDETQVRSRRSSCDSGSYDHDKKVSKKSEPARKRYRCSECTKVFSAKSHYDDHVATHSDMRPFKCDLCGKAFKFKRGLKEHLKSMHGGIGLEAFGSNGEHCQMPSIEGAAPTLMRSDTATGGKDYDEEDEEDKASAGSDSSPLPPLLHDSGVNVEVAALTQEETIMAGDTPSQQELPQRGNVSSVSRRKGNRVRAMAELPLPPPLDDEEGRDEEDAEDREEEDGNENPLTLRQKNASCSSCDTSLLKRDTAKERAVCSSPPPMGYFPCELCESRFKYKRGLVSHLRRKHGGDNSGGGEECEAATAQLDRLRGTTARVVDKRASFADAATLAAAVAELKEGRRSMVLAGKSHRSNNNESPLKGSLNGDGVGKLFDDAAGSSDSDTVMKMKQDEDGEAVNGAKRVCLDSSTNGHT